MDIFVIDHYSELGHVNYCKITVEYRSSMSMWTVVGCTFEGGGLFIEFISRAKMHAWMF